MSILLKTQPAIDPIEFTHFDTWGQDGEGREDLDIEQQQQIWEDIVTVWETNLGCELAPEKLYDNIGLNVYSCITLDGVIDLTIFNLLKAEYNVYIGDGFIEIYPVDSIKVVI